MVVICHMSTDNYTVTIDITATCGFGFFPRGKGLKNCLKQPYSSGNNPKNSLFKIRKKIRGLRISIQCKVRKIIAS